MNTVVKIVKSRRVDYPDYRRADLEESDAHEYGVYAMKSNAWRTACEISSATTISHVYECAVLIASPDGRVGLWYGYDSTAGPTMSKGKAYRLRAPSERRAAAAALGCRAAAAQWGRRHVFGSDRDITPLSLAACRVLHADAFGYEASIRDRYLAELAVLEGANRPATPIILRASDDALAAASVLLAVRNYAGVCDLLTGKGVAA